MDDTDVRTLAERIDRSFGTGPDSLPPTEALLARGRRVRRHRRTAGVVGVVATALALGSTALVATAGDGARAPDSDAFVGSPHPAPTSFLTRCSLCSPAAGDHAPDLSRERLSALIDRVAQFDRDGDVTLAQGATEVDRIRNPYSLTSPQWSLGLAVSYRGQVFWYAETGSGDGTAGGVARPAGPDTTFADFVAAEDSRGRVVLFSGPDVWPEVAAIEAVTMTAAGRLEAADGYTVVEQRAGVDVGHAWADRTDTTAAALVRADDGTDYYVLARHLPGQHPQFVTLPQAGNGAGLDAFLALARERYATVDR